MAVDVVPIPSQVPRNSLIKLARTSGRPAAFYYDTGKTLGPNFGLYLDRSVTLYADTGPYRLSYIAPSGDTGTINIMVGTVATPLPDVGAGATVGDVESLIAQAILGLDVRYTRPDTAETITAPWTFDVAPELADGSPIGGGLSSSQVNTLIGTALSAQTVSDDSRYLRLVSGASQTVSSAVDFVTAPTVGGSPIGGDAGVLTAAQAAAASAAAAAAAAAASATAAQATADAASQITGQPGPRGEGVVTLFPLSPLPSDFVSGVVLTPRQEITATTSPSTDTFTSVAHGMPNATPIGVKSGPAPLVSTVIPITAAGPFYWTINVTADTFQLAAVPNGTVIDVTGSAALVYTP